MPIYTLLQNSAFEPTEVEALAEAFETICSQLQVTTANDPMRDRVARKVIELAECGTRDQQEICILVLAAIQGINKHNGGDTDRLNDSTGVGSLN